MYERQLIITNIDLFASNNKTKFYEKNFDTIADNQNVLTLNP